MKDFIIHTIRVIAILSVFNFAACRNNTQLPGYSFVDTLKADNFFSTESICDFAVAKDYRPIHPQMIPWATDSADLETESYIIDGKRLTITQPLKRPNMQDSSRRYSYGKSVIRTVRVINDTLDFNFNNLTFDYGIEPQNIFQKSNFILLRNEPMAWCGLANRYRFIQLFDLTKLICYEFFVDYYSCANNDSTAERH